MFANLGTGELLIIVLVLVVLFGGNKITQLARGAGEAGRELKKAKKDLMGAKQDLLKDIDTVTPPVSTPSKKTKKHKSSY